MGVACGSRQSLAVGQLQIDTTSFVGTEEYIAPEVTHPLNSEPVCSIDQCDCWWVASFVNTSFPRQPSHYIAPIPLPPPP